MCSMSSSNNPLIVAITGGMGSGKTTVLQCFEALGIPCFCADAEAAMLYNDHAFCEKLRKALGDCVFDNGGAVDKKAVAKLVFSNKDKLQELNDLVHPQVMRMFREWVQRHGTAPYVLFESAIVFESGLQRHFDKVICVTAPLDLRIRRVVKRDHTTPELVRQRIANQLDDEWKIARSDYVVRNQYGPKRRQQSVQNIHNKILKYLQKQ